MFEGRVSGGGKMNILIACEFSGIVRDAFIAKGHNAVSCDLLATENPRFGHIQSALSMQILEEGWNMMIAFPPCTHLAVSGARWFKNKTKEQQDAIKFFMDIVNCFGSKVPIRRIAIENPIGIMSSVYRKPDQIIQPWQFGHGETKATCLWLKGLPKLIPTNIVIGREHRIHKMPT